jgi:hypothetical protein
LALSPQKLLLLTRDERIPEYIEFDRHGRGLDRPAMAGFVAPQLANWNCWDAAPASSALVKSNATLDRVSVRHRQLSQARSRSGRGVAIAGQGRIPTQSGHRFRFEASNLSRYGARSPRISNCGSPRPSMVDEEMGMPAKRELSMRQLRHPLRLHHGGVSAREIGRHLGVARSTIQDNLKRAAAAGLAWPLAADVTDELSSCGCSGAPE